MPDAIRNLKSLAALPAEERTYDDVLRLAVLEPRTILRLQLAVGAQQAGKLRIPGQRLPEAMNSFIGENPVVARLAPDSWLFLAAWHAAPALMAALRAACARRLFALTDLSDANATIAVEGPRAIEILARGCGLDIAMLADDACLRTRFAQLPVVLRRAAAERYELLVDRAVAKYLFDWLQDAAAGLD